VNARPVETDVLVVGGGNTGFQIAKELSATHTVVLSVGSRQKPLPQRLLGRDLFWWLAKVRILDKTVDSRLGRKLSKRDTLIGSSPREMTKRYGVELEPRLVDAKGRKVHFEGGRELEVDAVIWATAAEATSDRKRANSARRIIDQLRTVVRLEPLCAENPPRGHP